MELMFAVLLGFVGGGMVGVAIAKDNIRLGVVGTLLIIISGIIVGARNAEAIFSLLKLIRIS
jgi:hypothetical protein